MSEFTTNIQIIRQYLETLRDFAIQSLPQHYLDDATEDVFIALDNLQLIQEQNQACIEAMEIVEEELMNQCENLAQKHQYYHGMFDLAPDAYLFTNAEGVILEANLRAARLLEVSQQYLIGKPLANFISIDECSMFSSLLNELAYAKSVEDWEISMCTPEGRVFDASLLAAPICDSSGKLVSLRISVRDITKYKQINNSQTLIAMAGTFDCASVIGGT